MKIAVIGSYGNGKTTLSRALESSCGIARVHAKPMNTVIDRPNVTLENCSIPELFELSIKRYTERLVSETLAGSNFISDGSAMHEWVYLESRLLHERFPEKEKLFKGVGGEAVNYARNMSNVAFDYAAKTYDVVILVPNESQLQDSPPPISNTFRELLNNLYEEKLTHFGIKYIKVSGGLESRIEQSLLVIKNKY